MALKTYQLPPASGQPAKSVVIFLHGLGDSGSGGLLDIGRIWSRVLPDTGFLCPDAPFPFDMAPPDFGGRQWFSLREFSQTAIEQGVKNAAPILDGFIDTVITNYKLPSSKIALVGFSQGTMMALYTAPRRAEAVAAVIGYSGKLVCGNELGTEKKSTPPILLVHGMDDEVVPFRAMTEAEQGLKTTGFDVRSLPCPHLAHSINDAGIEAGMAFLQQRLAG